MSVGKILRKIVKRWLKRDSESGVVEPTEYELYAETKVPLATGPLDSEPCLQDCVFCIESDGTYGGGGDLNRNVHISDEMGFSSDSIGGYRKCRLDEWNCELSETSYSSSCPLHGLNGFMGDPTEFPFDPTYESSHQSPVPLCVCETCYIFVNSHLSLHLPSTPFAALPPRAAADAAAAGQPLCDSDTRRWSNRCSTGQLDSSKGSSRTGRLGTTTTTKEMKPADCNEDGSMSVTSNRRFHSIMNQKSPSCSMEHLPKTTTTMGSSGQVNLPQSVHVSLDGEEGFVEGQRRLRCINRWEDNAAHKSFRPPPNKTICHVAK